MNTQTRTPTDTHYRTHTQTMKLTSILAFKTIKQNSEIIERT